jgi:hypothetical protein
MARESGSSGHVYLDVLDRVLDKGIVIDAAVRISLAGVQLLGVDAGVVVASIKTYLRHADTLAYTDLAAAPRSAPPPPLYAEPLERGIAALTAVEPTATDVPLEAALEDPTLPPDPAAAPHEPPQVGEAIEDG